MLHVLCVHSTACCSLGVLLGSTQPELVTDCGSLMVLCVLMCPLCRTALVISSLSPGARGAEVVAAASAALSAASAALLHGKALFDSSAPIRSLHSKCELHQGPSGLECFAWSALPQDAAYNLT